jgi:hypothetical protein
MKRNASLDAGLMSGVQKRYGQPCPDGNPCKTHRADTDNGATKAYEKAMTGPSDYVKFRPVQIMKRETAGPDFESA